MKKRDLTLERKIGICVLGLLVFLAISCSQDVLAVDSNVTLKVNAATSADANKIYYATAAASPTAVTVTLPWLEKAVYSGDPTNVQVTVKTLNVTGDLIIKADFLIATTPGALSLATPGGISTSSSSGGALTVVSYWLKYKDDAGPFGGPGIVFVENDDMETRTATTSGGIAGALTRVNAASLPTLVLKKSLSPTTFTLFAATVGFKEPVHVIFTAVLVNDAAAHNPQVMGVDVQSIFFNYIDRTGNQLSTWPNTGDLDAARPVWLDLIQAWSRWTP